jgi:NAD(P)-dependent dehydrogenase (short-subunit alcohol dehydrogenase family)
MGWLDGKRVLSIGGASGIGRAAVGAFADEGARLAVMDISGDALEILAKELDDTVVPVQGDTTVLEDSQRAVAEAVRAFGGIDVLLYFPGVFDFGAGLAEIPAEALGAAYDELFSINVKGVLFAVKAALPELLKSEGSIVLTVSTSGFHPGSGGVLYTPSKYAVRGLVTQLAYELAPKIRVNGVAPGGTVTGIRGVKALGQDGISIKTMLPSEDAAKQMIVAGTPLDWDPVPETHASAYVYLAAHDRASAVTGQIISSDGGVGVRGVLKLAGMKNGGVA